MWYHVVIEVRQHPPPNSKAGSSERSMVMNEIGKFENEMRNILAGAVELDEFDRMALKSIGKVVRDPVLSVYEVDKDCGKWGSRRYFTEFEEACAAWLRDFYAAGSLKRSFAKTWPWHAAELAKRAAA